MRTRDQKCRVLGQRAHARARGTNFTGLEVAHIYPIGWIDKVSLSNQLAGSGLKSSFKRQGMCLTTITLAENCLLPRRRRTLHAMHYSCALMCMPTLMITKLEFMYVHHGLTQRKFINEIILKYRSQSTQMITGFIISSKVARQGSRMKSDIYILLPK